MTIYKIRFTPAATRALTYELPPKIAAAAEALIFGDLSKNSRRVGKPLGKPFSPAYVARRGDYRIIYLIDDDVIEILITKVGYRGTVYRKN